MNPLETIKSFVCESPIEILRRLAEKSRLNQSELKKLPLLKIYLKASVLIGVLIQYQEDARSAKVLIGETDSAGVEIKTITYLEASVIEALTVQNYADLSKYLKPALEQGRLGETVPSKLELTRKAKAISDDVSARLQSQTELWIDWDLVPQGDHSFFNLSDLLNEVKTSVFEMSADDVGRQALRVISQWRIQNKAGAGLDFKKEDAGLSITVDLENFDLNEFKKAMKEKTEKLI